MSARSVTFGVLGLAVLVLAFVGGQRAVSEDFETPSAEPIPVWRTPAFLVFDFLAPHADYVTIENPRAAEGKVFYIVEFHNWGNSLMYIPEINPELAFDTNDAFDPPIPFTTTMTLWPPSGTGRRLTLAGYWSARQADIEVIDVP